MLIPHKQQNQMLPSSEHLYSINCVPSSDCQLLMTIYCRQIFSMSIYIHSAIHKEVRWILLIAFGMRLRFLPSILNVCCYFAYLMHAYLKYILNNPLLKINSLSSQSLKMSFKNISERRRKKNTFFLFFKRTTLCVIVQNKISNLSCKLLYNRFWQRKGKRIAQIK